MCSGYKCSSLIWWFSLPLTETISLLDDEVSGWKDINKIAVHIIDDIYWSDVIERFRNETDQIVQ